MLEQNAGAVTDYGLCPLCGISITSEDNLDPGGPQYMKQDGASVRVHVDCYWKGLDAEGLSAGHVAHRFGGK